MKEIMKIILEILMFRLGNRILSYALFNAYHYYWNLVFPYKLFG
jgi:hypothetical protein